MLITLKPLGQFWQNFEGSFRKKIVFFWNFFWGGTPPPWGCYLLTPGWKNVFRPFSLKPLVFPLSKKNLCYTLFQCGFYRVGFFFTLDREKPGGPNPHSTPGVASSKVGLTKNLLISKLFVRVGLVNKTFSVFRFDPLGDPWGGWNPTI